MIRYHIIRLVMLLRELVHLRSISNGYVLNILGELLRFLTLKDKQ